MFKKIILSFLGVMLPIKLNEGRTENGREVGSTFHYFGVPLAGQGGGGIIKRHNRRDHIYMYSRPSSKHTFLKGSSTSC
jgi:hypothetical protein